MSTIVGARNTEERGHELGRLGKATRRLRALSDRDVLLAGRRACIAENKAHAERWLCFVEFFRRRLATEKRKREASPYFALTARQEIVVEIGSLWGVDAARVRKELNVALYLCEYGGMIWQRCLAGQLEAHRATLIADAARQRLDDPRQVARFMRRMLKFVDKHLQGVDGDPEAEPMVTCTVRQLRNKIDYEMRLLDPVRSEEEFRAAYEGRVTSAREDVPGMGWLSINNRIDKVRLAQHRLTLAARRKQEAGDERTLDQIRADLALDLLAGDGETAPVPKYARPIVNLTVPIQTVMGLADAPGVLSGGTVVPATLARMIVADPDSTWHRMLVDDAGRMVELSTKSYKPTGPIWEHVVAEHGTCFRPGCDAPSTEGDLDHRLAWPIGRTDTTNLWPGCRTDHRTKHAPGFRVEQEDGSYVLRTPTGFRHRIEPTPHPAMDTWDSPELHDGGFQVSASELIQALQAMRRARKEYVAAPELLWEAGFDQGLTEEEWKAVQLRESEAS
jgi:hypothetical protein